MVDLIRDQAALDPFRGYANAIHEGLPDRP
jgi:hypothetical protein